MTPVNIVDNEYISVQYLPEGKIISHIVHQPIPDDMLKDALNAGTEALRQYGVCKWLSDDRLNGPLSDEILEWGFNDWDPRTVAAGWKYWANVVPHELEAAGTLMPVIEALHKMGLRMMTFTSVEKARQWLDSLPG